MFCRILFLEFIPDLRDIKTSTKMEMDKSEVIRLYENHLHGNHDSITKLRQNIFPSTSTQYKKGI